MSKIEIPEFEDFHNYAKTFPNYSLSYEFALKAKYEAWQDEGWRDGHGKPIKNWKSKLKNTWPHLKPTQNQSKKVPTEVAAARILSGQSSLNRTQYEWNNEPKQIEG